MLNDVQLEELQLVYDQLLQKHERVTAQLQRTARVERQRAKSAKSSEVKKSAQLGELHTIIRSLLERVRSQLSEAGSGDGHRSMRMGTVTRPHTAVGAISACHSHGVSRPMSAVERPFSACSNMRNAAGEIGFRSARYMRPLSSPSWGARPGGLRGADTRRVGLEQVREEYMGGKKRLSEEPHRSSVTRWSQARQTVVGTFGLDLNETEQDALIHELMRQERVLELVQAAMGNTGARVSPERTTELAEDDDGVEELNEEGVWVVR